MRSTAQGSFAAVLLLIPILAIPMLAIFGVPDFAPHVESPLGQPAEGEPAADDAPPFSPAVSLSDAEFTTLPQGGKNGVAAWPAQAVQPVASQADQQQMARLQAVRQAGFQQPESEPRMAMASAAPMTPSPFAQTEIPEVAPPMQPAPRPAAVPNPPMANPGFTAPAAPPTAAVSPALTWRAAVQRLNQMEIRNFRLEPGRTPDQFVFICSYTPRDNPRVSYRFEAEADEPLKAVEKVLAQIDSWLASR